MMVFVFLFTSMEAFRSSKPPRLSPLQPTGSRTESKHGIPATEAYRLLTSRGSREAWEEV